MIITPTYEMTRATGTTQYAQNELVANHATAGNVIPMKWSLQRVGGNGIIRGAKIAKTNTTVTAANFNIHLFTQAPVPSNGDNGAFAISTARYYLGKINVDMSSGSQAGTAYVWKASAAVAIFVDLADPTLSIYGLLETATSATYTPTDSEIFAVTLDIERN